MNINIHKKYRKKTKQKEKNYTFEKLGVQKKYHNFYSTKISWHVILHGFRSYLAPVFEILVGRSCPSPLPLYDEEIKEFYETLDLCSVWVVKYQ